MYILAGEPRDGPSERKEDRELWSWRCEFGNIAGTSAKDTKISCRHNRRKLISSFENYVKYTRMIIRSLRIWSFPGFVGDIWIEESFLRIPQTDKHEFVNSDNRSRLIIRKDHYRCYWLQQILGPLPKTEYGWICRLLFSETLQIKLSQDLTDEDTQR